MDVETHIDPEVRDILATLPLADWDPGKLELSQIPHLRAAMEAAAPAIQMPPTTTVHRDEVVSGDHDVTVRVFDTPGRTEMRPCIYWIHGGGYMLGSALVDDPLSNRWTEELECVLASVEYRLAPEHPYPAPLDDCYAGLEWTFRNAGELGIDPSRIVIAGRSAGGGLCAGLALLARDRGELQPSFQLLIYPMIDDRNVTPSSHIENAPIWSRGANLLGWRAYLGHEPGTGEPPLYAVPARATDLAGLPPAFICVGTIDVFRDENIAYASRLLAAGVATELHVYPGGPHGFDILAPTAAVSRRCQADMDDALRRALHPATQPVAG